MKAVLLDMWMTLVEPTVPDRVYHEVRVRGLLEASGLPADEMMEEAMKTYMEVRRELRDLRRRTLSEVPVREEISMILGRLGVKAQVTRDHLEAYAEPFVRLTRLREGAREALEWIKSTGLPAVVVANSRSREMVVWKLEVENLLNLLRGVVTSGEVGRAKPHPEIFRRALEVAGGNAEESVMVGDDPEADVAGAKSLGMMAVHVAPLGAGDPRADAVVDKLLDLPTVLGRLLL